MTPSSLGMLLADPSLASCLLVDARQRDDCADAAAGIGLQTVTVDCAGACHRDEALARFAQALRFPDTFGVNWDALLDCITDLSWWPASGYLLLIDNTEPWSDAEPEAFATLFDVLQETASRWAACSVPFWSMISQRDAAGACEAPARA